MLNMYVIDSIMGMCRLKKIPLHLSTTTTKVGTCMSSANLSTSWWGSVVLPKFRPSCYHANSTRNVWYRRVGVFRGLGVVAETKSCYPRDSNAGKACRQPLTLVIPVYSK